MSQPRQPLTPLVSVEQLQRPVPGGTGTYVLGLLRGFEDLATTVDAYKASGFIAALGSRSQRLHGGGEVFSSHLPVRLLTTLWSRGGRLNIAGKHSLFHATSPAFPVVEGAPLTVTIHDTAWRDVPAAFSPKARKWHERRVRQALQSAQVIFTPAQSVKKSLVDDGADASQVRVFREGVDHLEAPDIDEVGPFLKAFGVTGEFILTAGTLEPRKNLATLLRAYRKAKETSALPPLVIVGPAGWGDAGLGSGEKDVHLVGRVTPALLSALYKSCTLFVAVPLAEGYGLPQVEAMSMGAPVVSSPVPSIEDAQAPAMVVEPTDVDSVASALTQVTSSAELRAELVDKGLRHTRNLKWRDAAQSHLDAWEQFSR